MKKLIVLSSTLTILSACDFFMGKKTDPTPVPPPSAVEETETQLKKGPANLDCQDSGFSKPASKGIFKMDNGVEFVLCEAFELIDQGMDTFSGWGNIYQRKEKITPVLEDVNSEKPDDVYSFLFKKKDGKEILITRQVLSLMEDAGGENVNVTERVITCAKPNQCDIGREKCIDFKKTMTADKKSIEKVQQVIAGKLEPQDAGYYDIAIGGLITSALAGDQTAKKLIFDTKEEKLKLDGAAAETYRDGKRLLLKLKELKCL